MTKELLQTMSDKELAATLKPYLTTAMNHLETKIVYKVAKDAVARTYAGIYGEIPFTDAILYFNHPDEGKDLATVYYAAKSEEERQALDFITLILGRLLYMLYKQLDHTVTAPDPILNAGLDEVLDEIGRLAKQYE